MVVVVVDTIVSFREYLKLLLVANIDRMTVARRPRPRLASDESKRDKEEQVSVTRSAT